MLVPRAPGVKLLVRQQTYSDGPQHEIMMKAAWVLGKKRNRSLTGSVVTKRKRDLNTPQIG
jgi:hypothetical protein